MDVVINYWGVLAAAVAGVVVGMLWYHSSVFGTTWLKLAKIDPKKGSMVWSMGSVIISSLIMSYVLARMTYLTHYFFGNGYLRNALTTGFWVWLGFQGLRMFMHDQFNQRRKKESLIHMGNDFVTIMVMAFVIGLIGLGR